MQHYAAISAKAELIVTSMASCDRGKCPPISVRV